MLLAVTIKTHGIETTFLYSPIYKEANLGAAKVKAKKLCDDLGFEFIKAAPIRPLETIIKWDAEQRQMAAST